MRISLAERISPSPPKESCKAPIRFTALNSGLNESFFAAFIYSTASVSFGEESTGEKTSPNFLLKAFCRAAGYETPLLSSESRALSNPGCKSASAQSSKSRLSPHSEPNASASKTPHEERTETPPNAKFSALETANVTGSAKTRSTPFLRAQSVLAPGRKDAVSPRCTKHSLITALTVPPSLFTASKNALCPL